MSTNIERLREEIRQLHLKRARGDLRERSFQRALTQTTIDLYRATVQKSMARDERILHEHHVVQAHTRLTQSVLKEPEQHATSLFATDRNLIRLRSTIASDQSTTCDDRDGTVIDQVALSKIEGLKPHRQMRPGEVWTGLGMAALAFLFQDWLEVTGYILMFLGLLGAAHGLLFPTRSWEVLTRGSKTQDSFFVLAPAKKSGRAMVRLLRERVRSIPTVPTDR